MPSGIYKRTKHWKVKDTSNISKSHIGLKYPNRKKPASFTEEHKRKIKENHRKYQSEITKEKIRIANLGKKGYWLNKKRPPLSDITRKKISIAMRGCSHLNQRGEKSPFWKGGIANDPYSYDWTDILRESIRERDNYVCQICGIHQDELNGWHKKLDIHHIDYNKDNLNPDNLITLCHRCHSKTNYNREYWINFLRHLIANNNL